VRAMDGVRLADGINRDPADPTHRQSLLRQGARADGLSWKRRECHLEIRTVVRVGTTEQAALASGGEDADIINEVAPAISKVGQARRRVLEVERLGGFNVR